MRRQPGSNGETSSQTVHTATETIDELAGSEKMANENQTRASMYTILASLATIDELILKDASEEEILEEIEKIKQADARFEDTRQLEEKAKQKA